MQGEVKLAGTGSFDDDEDDDDEDIEENENIKEVGDRKGLFGDSLGDNNKESAGWKLGESGRVRVRSTRDRSPRRDRKVENCPVLSCNVISFLILSCRSVLYCFILCCAGRFL